MNESISPGFWCAIACSQVWFAADWKPYSLIFGGGWLLLAVLQYMTRDRKSASPPPPQPVEPTP